ncbi:MAG: ribonuclease/clavin/mitogillin [Planctomycetota bacterium]|jgi:ribonuclease/clavin/mitogillin
MRNSATIVLTRQTSSGPEVYLVERAPQLRFFGGYLAFPGGVVDAVDQGPAQDDLGLALERCALRELFEETGVLPPALQQAIAPERRKALRERLLERNSDAEPWREFLPAVDLARADLRLLTKITTPPFAPLRHTTPFLHMELPAGQEPEIIQGELVGGAFWKVEALFERWTAGELAVVPPVLFLLEHLRGGDLESFFIKARESGEALEAGQLHRAYYSPGVMVAPLRTPTLPPATTTNTVLIGQEHVYIVDPATPELSEQERLFETLDRWVSEGRLLEAVLLTHHHHDHVGAAVAVANRYDLPVMAHAETFSRVELEGVRQRELKDGDRLMLGNAPDGREAWQLEVHLTPGHAHGHLVFIEDRYRTAVVGDLVSTLSTIVIDPPEGHMATYIDSLHAILAEDIGVLIPSHGPAHRTGAKTLKYHIQRRVAREEKLLDALKSGNRSHEELLPLVYDDAPEEVMPYAARSLLAGLIKLSEEQRAREIGGRWSLCAKS